jgi:hypothetical protein
MRAGSALCLVPVHTTCSSGWRWVDGKLLHAPGLALTSPVFVTGVPGSEWAEFLTRHLPRPSDAKRCAEDEGCSGRYAMLSGRGVGWFGGAKQKITIDRWRRKLQACRYRHGMWRSRLGMGARFCTEAGRAGIAQPGMASLCCRHGACIYF